MRIILALCSLIGLAACVAPEAPTPPPRPAAAVQPPPSRVGFEDAPMPNRKVGPVNESIIRLAR